MIFSRGGAVFFIDTARRSVARRPTMAAAMPSPRPIGARIQTSRSSSIVRITGFALE
jgi:hypothetical protein